MSEGCECCNGDKKCNIILNITFNDNRMDKDASTYVDHLIMEDGGGCDDDCNCVEE